MSSNLDAPQARRIRGVTCLESPIDAMYLIHKALRVEGDRVENMVRDLREGDSLQPIKGAFSQWAAALMYHADREDLHMTSYLPHFTPASDNETEHKELATLLEDLETLLEPGDRSSIKTCVARAVMALHEAQREQLMDCLEGVMTVLNQGIGKTKCLAAPKGTSIAAWLPYGWPRPVRVAQLGGSCRQLVALQFRRP
jgi:hypothetical protein